MEGKSSNIYKLYRATRAGTESEINPAQQICYYDTGLESGESKSLMGNIKKLVSAGTGLGISYNITSCYEAILKNYESGDRIYLFGFSRGAYTIRNLAGVLNLCVLYQVTLQNIF